MKFIKDYSQQIQRLKNAIKEADAILIGAGAGLSTAAGFTYSGERFNKYFSEFYKKYGFKDMYSGGFYPFDTLEEFWAYWSLQIAVNRYGKIPNTVYEDLLKLVQDKEYFILTSNVDHCFQRAGFNKKRLFYMQGDYGLFQCSEPCHQKTYDNQEIIEAMVDQQKDLKIPSSLIPHCPRCGKPMTTNLRIDNRFVEDEGWHQAAKRYEKFLEKYSNRKILFLELGVGYNTPGIIKYPFWQMTENNPQAVYVSINNQESFIPSEIQSKAIILCEDIKKVIEDLQ